MSHAMAQLFRWNHSITGKGQKVSTPIIAKVTATDTLFSAEVPAGYPYKESNNNNSNNNNNNNSNNNNNNK